MTATYTKFLNGLGFKTGNGCSCNFAHATGEVSLIMRGDDFTASRSDVDLAWLEARFKERFKCKVQMLWPGRGQQREVRVLNIVIRWS